MSDDREEVGAPPGCMQSAGVIAAVILGAMFVLVGLVLYTCRF